MKYVKPEMEVREFGFENILTVSGDGVSDGENEDSTTVPRI